jgi:hypothetical protein
MGTRLRGFRLGAVALAACLGCGGGGGPAIDKDNQTKIRPGMPLAEVEKILGGEGTEITKADFAKLAGLPPDLKMPGPPGPGGPGFPPGGPGGPKILPKPEGPKGPGDDPAKDLPKSDDRGQKADGQPVPGDKGDAPEPKGGPPLPRMPPMPGGPPGMPGGMGMPELTTATRFIRWGDDSRYTLVAFAGDVVVMAFQRGQ